jgi:hypothetical protein
VDGVGVGLGGGWGSWGLILFWGGLRDGRDGLKIGWDRGGKSTDLKTGHYGRRGRSMGLWMGLYRGRLLGG